MEEIEDFNMIVDRNGKGMCTISGIAMEYEFLKAKKKFPNLCEVQTYIAH